MALKNHFGYGIKNHFGYGFKIILGVALKIIFGMTLKTILGMALKPSFKPNLKEFVQFIFFKTRSFYDFWDENFLLYVVNSLDGKAKTEMSYLSHFTHEYNLEKNKIFSKCSSLCILVCVCIYIYIYIFVCVCVCVWEREGKILYALRRFKLNS